MSDEGTPITGGLAKSIKRGDIPLDTPEQSKEKAQPSYRVVGDTRLPVSKHLGKLWKSRKQAAIARREQNKTTDAWNEAIKYYKNDQLSHRHAGNPDMPQNMGDSISDTYTETENIVFANTSALVPTLYSKNPVVECTTPTQDEQQKKLVTRIERLVNRLFEMKNEPGVNLKPKARRAIVLATLTNNVWIETGWTFKEASSEQAFADLTALTKEYEEAKDIKAIQEVEGKLQALEARMDVLRPAGPFTRVRSPFDILVDPASLEGDATDAMWMIDFDYMPTDFLRAMYAQKDAETGEYKSVFQPTHVMKLKGRGETDSIDDEIAQFTLLDSNSNEVSHTAYGFEDTNTFRKSQYTRVARVWDKTTRRVYLFNDNDWSWPIWVWDDPYQFPDFFPFDPLQFYVDPLGEETKGEVSYYLDQQDAINEINSEKRLARQWARKNIVFDKNRMDADDVTAMITGQKQGAFGIDVPEGAKIDDILKAIVPPSANFMQLFDKQSQLDAIDRLSSVRSVQRGAEFKTNTTNEAIKRYDATSETRLDEKIDAIEDFLGRIGSRIAFLCLCHMDAQTVDQLIGPSDVAWQNLPPKEAAQFAMTVVGGSTQKPSSGAKKEEAVQVGQVLGQFVKASPIALVVALKVMEEAFDSVVIKEEDWTLIRESVAQQLQGEQQGQPGGEAGGNIMAMYDKLPPEAKKAFGEATAKGAPAGQAIQMIMQEVQGMQSEQQQQQQQPMDQPEGPNP